MLLNMNDSRMTSRLTKEMRKVIETDSHNPRGSRKISQGQLMSLNGFEFNNRSKLGSTFLAPFTPGIDRVQGKLKVDVDSFVPGTAVAAAKGATHCKLVVAGAEADFDNSKYVVNSTRTPEIMLDQQVEAAQSLTVNVTAGTKLPVFIVFGIQFLQLVNGIFYPLQNGQYDAMAIVLTDSTLV